MSRSFLVLHGPNLATRAREEIDPAIEKRAAALGVDLTILQKNGEEGLLDSLHAHADQVDAVVVNAGVLAPTAVALAEALALLGLPAIEVTLVKAKTASALASVVKASLEGVEGYVAALEQLAGTPVREKKTAPLPSSAPVPRGKTIGRKAARAAEAPEAPTGKTIGRTQGEEKKPASLGVTRKQVSARIKERLQGEATSDELAHWARETWTSLQRGASVEPGAKDTIENVLLTLMAGAKVSDAMLVAQMAKLDS